MECGLRQRALKRELSFDVSLQQEARRDWNDDQLLKEYSRRTVGLSLGLSPVALLLWSLLQGLQGGAQETFLGIGFVLTGLVFGTINFCLSFIRPYLCIRRHVSVEDHRFVSGLPIVGTLFVVVGGIYGFGAIGTAALGLLVMALDTGGSVWILIATWRDESIWEAQI